MFLFENTLKKFRKKSPPVKKSKFVQGPVAYLQFFCALRSVMMILNLPESLAKPLVMAKLNMAYICAKFERPWKTVVVLLAGVTISGTPYPRHITEPFDAEAPSGHAAQAWAIPPPSRRRWDCSGFPLPMAPTRDDTVRDERSVLRPTQRHSWEISRFIWRQNTLL